jgi:hypothetical protein
MFSRIKSRINDCKQSDSFEAPSKSYEKGLLASPYPYVRLSAWNNSVPTGQILVKFNILVFLEICVEKFKFHLNRTRITGTLHEDQYTLFYHISLSSS